ncbi:MAG: DUF192 domain-containing protein [bacterium]|nr:DUF192 domain-containing protein [bacterium]
MILNKQDNIKKDANAINSNINSFNKNYTFIKINNTTASVVLKAEVVNTEPSRALGLSDKLEMMEDEGMLFVFDNMGHYPFWMKDMHFAIDMIWLDMNKEIVFIAKDVGPESFPANFGGEEESLYVLEVVSGFTNKYNLQIGDKLDF